jgi:hypothetical protein
MVAAAASYWSGLGGDESVGQPLELSISSSFSSLVLSVIPTPFFFLYESPISSELPSYVRHPVYFSCF